MEDIIALLTNLMFWVKVLAGCAIWYLIALFLSRMFFESRGDAVDAARAGAMVSLVPAPLLVAVIAWFWWGDLALTLALAVFTLLIPLLVSMLLIVLEPARR